MFVRTAFALLASLASAPSARAQADAPERQRAVELSLYARQGVSRLWPARGTLIRTFEPPVSWGQETELRLMANVRWGSWLQFELHNETFYQAGPARRPLFEIASSPEPPFLDTDSSMTDRRRLFDLSWTIDRSPERLLVNRFDRLSATLFVGGTKLRAGRHVVSWGNGLLFNPFDLFSPFAPMEIDRDYKRGEDGVSWAIDAGERFGDIEIVSLFKRDGRTGEVGSRQASFGVKHHRLIADGKWEITSLAGGHLGDLVLGGGVMGRVGDVVGRSEWVYSALADGGGSSWTGIVNVDLAWVWKGMNSHAGVEYYFSGFGNSVHEDVENARARALRARLARGELFVRGRHYLDTVFDVEAHPLVRIAVNTVTNLSDASGILQPSLTWDATSRIQARITATCMRGSRGTEFGGLRDIATGLTDRMPNRIDVRVTTTF